MKIKTIKIVTLSNQNPDYRQLSSVINYDENGNETQVIQNNETGELESKTETKYNENNKKAEQINYLSETEIAEHYIFERNENGTIQKEIIKYADGSHSEKKYLRNKESRELTIETVDDQNDLEEKITMKFNQNDDIIWSRHYDEENTLTDKIEYYYDDKKRLIEQKEYDANEQLIKKRKIIYHPDFEEKITKQISLTPEDTLIDFIQNEYDKKGRLTEQSFNNKYFIKNKYDDEQNTRTEEKYYSNGMLDGKTIFYFDKNGLLQKEIYDLYTLKYDYEFYDNEEAGK